MSYKYYWCDVFTEQKFGGNPLVVFPNAEGISAQEMQQIAREFNISETVFVLPPKNPKNTCRLRIFTPNSEIPFAGHPTIGTAYILGLISAIPLENDLTKIIFEEKIGEIPVSIISKNGKPIYTQLTASQLPEIGEKPPDISILAELLSLETSDLLIGEDYPQAISCGLPFLFIPLVNQAALQKAKLGREVWQQELANYCAPHIFLFTYETVFPSSHIAARMFAPGLGIDEDPATGSAATALAGYLAMRSPTVDGTSHWQVEQGLAMGRPSILQVEADKQQGQITEIRVAGASVLVSEGKYS
jgi:trans-2,3-dihydro-3-hydroxyanthranilate isomerase